ncbi:MAG TPA: gamma-glutamylcyclotransferase [Burkholderiaceae bacterium]|jgi:glutathione-specific gamma-glutamylcyclotransferase|nr:gamma-glutamylcyclotransferase [Burkholderiaceae bacterium]HPE02237.1 gamma-glutamylcyclotransferase [Burkholderiaceae bacterium]HRZ02129.1 gamma-glutamylcyclotransferase [Burkholderiaceae bacterium]
MTEPLPRLSEATLAASRAALLADWDGSTPLWLFAYASLIWKPEVRFDARRAVRVHGYHRSLCLRSVAYRGTPERPGLVAGLARGGSCAGLALRVPAEAVPDEFARLWEREMFMGSYAPRWLAARTDDGQVLRALAFVVNPAAVNYCGRLPETEMLAILAHAHGRYGTSLDYLERTVAALRAEGLADPHLERLARKARAARSAGGEG